MVNRIRTTGKLISFRLVGMAFMATLLIWTLQSCQQDEMDVLSEAPAGILKSASTFGLPLFMDKDVPAGSATITHDPEQNLVRVTALLNNDLLSAGWSVVTGSMS